jgi:hypothetical protein
MGVDECGCLWTFLDARGWVWIWIVGLRGRRVDADRTVLNRWSGSHAKYQFICVPLEKVREQFRRKFWRSFDDGGDVLGWSVLIGQSYAMKNIPHPQLSKLYSMEWRNSR